MVPGSDLIVMSVSAHPPDDLANDASYIGRALLVNGNRIVVSEQRFQDELHTKGFGEKEGTEYLLKPYEALYLAYVKRLELHDGSKSTTGDKNGQFDFDSLFEVLVRQDKSILTRFLIYRDLRSRGYIAKEGFGFGIDFRVYGRGEFEKKPAKYVVFAINEGTNAKARKFFTMIEQIEKMGKEAIIAVIERRGEIIYYKASRMRFGENHYNTKVRSAGTEIYK